MTPQGHLGYKVEFYTRTERTEQPSEDGREVRLDSFTGTIKVGYWHKLVFPSDVPMFRKVPRVDVTHLSAHRHRLELFW